MKPPIEIMHQPWSHGWSVTLPHQCDNWEMGAIRVEDWGGVFADPAPTRQDAADSLRGVIYQLSRVLTVLEELDDDWEGEIEVGGGG